MKIDQKIDLENGKKIPLMESFLSIQGEGFFSGKSSYFLRIGGCDVGCHWCDVKESWDPSIHPLTKVDHIIDKIKQYSVKIVVVTGGEPLMYNLDYLCQSLKLLDIKIHLETSGAYMLSGNFDWICLSPKKTLKPLKNIYNISNELKIIVSNKNDLKWAQDQKKQVGDECKLYLQPEWSKRDIVMPLMVDFVKQNPKWKISLQSHKYLKVP